MRPATTHGVGQLLSQLGFATVLHLRQRLETSYSRHSRRSYIVQSMPPLQAQLYSQDSPTADRRQRRRGSAQVPPGLLKKHISLEPGLEEPSGVCLYAHDAVVTAGDAELDALMMSHHDLLTNNGSSSSLNSPLGRSGAGREDARRRASEARAARMAAAKEKERAEQEMGPFCFKLMSCSDSPCVIS